MTHLAPIIPLPTRDTYLEMARAFAAEAARDAVRRDAENYDLRREFAAWGRTGLLTLTIPKANGGPGLGYAELSRMIQIVAEADGALAQTTQTHFGTIDALRTFGSPEQRQWVFDLMLKGAVFGNAQVERGQRGVGLPNVRILRDGDDYVLSGQKFYTTGAWNGDWIRVSATDEEERFTFAIVPRDAAGLSFGHDWDLFGQKGTASMSITFDNVRVPADRVLHKREGAGPFLPLWATFMLVHSAIDIGMGRAALDAARELIAARGRLAPEAIGHGHASYLDDTHILYRFGEWETRQKAAELLQEDGARALDAVIDSDDAEAIGRATLEIAKAKTFGGEVALRMASDLFEFGGAGAANRTLGLDRLWRNLRVHTLHDASWWKYAQIGEHALSGKLPPPLPHQ